MAKLSYAQLSAACEPGGSTAISLVTELTPAGGPHAAVAPEPHGADRKTFAYETRLIDGEAVTTVVIDGKQAQLGRVEAAILQSILDDHPVLGRVPRVQVCYQDGQLRLTDLELPERIYDAQIRSGTVDGKPVTDHPVYRAAREDSPANARTLLELSPGSLVFGSWDVTRKGRQSRYRGALASEIIGVLADQSGARGADGGGRNTRVVACGRIIHTQVLSFTALRQLRFDCGPAGDTACRMLLAAYALAGLARANAELNLRADCDLVEAAPAAVTLDERDGDFAELQASSIDEADALLERAMTDAKREADIDWHGQVFRVTGNPASYAGLKAGTAGQPGGADAPTRPTLTHPGRPFTRRLFADAKPAE